MNKKNKSFDISFSNTLKNSALELPLDIVIKLDQLKNPSKKVNNDTELAKVANKQAKKNVA